MPTLASTGLTGWCLPPDTALSYGADPLNPPPGALIGTNPEAGGLEIRNLPASACTFLYTFNQPAPAGLKLEVHEPGNEYAWLTADLASVEAQPDTSSTILRHTYIAQLPVWEAHYEFVLRDAAGNILRTDPVHLYRWMPELCWNGQLPNLQTLRCPLQQDQHPWDPWYGKPMPTGEPEE